MSASTTYSISSSMPDGRRMSYNIHWKGKPEPIAVCGDFRDAERIRDALNALENVCPASLSGLQMKNPDATTRSLSKWGWIRVEDRLPGGCDLVLVYSETTRLLTTAYCDNGTWFESFAERPITTITHWHEINPPSKQTKPDASDDHCSNCGRKLAMSEVCVVGFPDHHVKGSRVFYCPTCSPPLTITLTDDAGSQHLIPNNQEETHDQN